MKSKRKKLSIKVIVITVLQILILIGTILIFFQAINLAEQERGYTAYGGEYFLPILGLLMVYIVGKLK